MGKTALDRIVHPARRRVRTRLAAAGVSLIGALDCGLVPRRTTLDRETATVTLTQGRLENSWNGTATPTGPAWGLTAVLTAPDAGVSVAAFAAAIEAGYTALPVADRLVVSKGHSVQVSDTDRTTITADLLRPRGAREPGYVLGNVDVVHGFPDLDPETQAEIAAAHAFNDCYAYGGTRERTLRPVVGVPATADTPSLETVRTWFDERAPASVTLLAPTVVCHGGRGWLFGATVTAEIAHTPPMHTGRLAPGDAVLLHRPLGAVAALAAGRADNAPAVRERAVAALRTDHSPVGEIVADHAPTAGERFDPARHLKLATDVSGPGVGGVADAVARNGHRLHVERLPFLDRAAVERARAQWLVPDATVGTNGPITMVGTPEVVERVASRLERVGAEPVRVGRVVERGGTEDGAVSTDDGVRLDRFVEDTAFYRTDVDDPSASRSHDD